MALNLPPVRTFMRRPHWVQNTFKAKIFNSPAVNSIYIHLRAFRRMPSNTKFVFVYGGVISGVGKGSTVSAIGRILQEYGFSVTAVKIDPYVNFDAGTLRPTE